MIRCPLQTPGLLSGIPRVFGDAPVEVACQEKEKVRDWSALSRIEELVCKELIGNVVRRKTDRQPLQQLSHRNLQTLLSCFDKTTETAIGL